MNQPSEVTKERVCSLIKNIHDLQYEERLEILKILQTILNPDKEVIHEHADGCRINLDLLSIEKIEILERALKNF